MAQALQVRGVLEQFSSSGNTRKSGLQAASRTAAARLTPVTAVTIVKRKKPEAKTMRREIDAW